MKVQTLEPPLDTSFHTIQQPIPTDFKSWQSQSEEVRYNSSLAEAPHPLPLNHTGRFIYVLSVAEGFGAWSDAIQESLFLAQYLNRTWVEPCVRNGCIEPCRCGAVRPVVAFSEQALKSARGAKVDPALLPRIDVECKTTWAVDGRLGVPDTFVAEAYPLSAYIDVQALLSAHPRVVAVNYAQYCTSQYAGTSPSPPRDPQYQRWVMPHKVYDFDQLPQYIEPAQPLAVGDFFFPAGSTVGRTEEALATLAQDTTPTLFLFRFFRGWFLQPYSVPTLPPSPWLVAAAQDFVGLHFPPGAKVRAVHWRSEQVDPATLPACAEKIAGALAGILSLPPPHTPPSPYSSALLLGDMPAPDNPAPKLWTDYVADEGVLAQQKAAVGYLLQRGFCKVDHGLPYAVDAGVLSQRDFIASVTADEYISCQGRHVEDCRGCFRAGSNLVFRVGRDRGGRGLNFSFDLFRLGGAMGDFEGEGGEGPGAGSGGEGDNATTPQVPPASAPAAVRALSSGALDPRIAFNYDLTDY